MEIRQIFLLLSQKGIDNVNLEMLPDSERKDIYEKYAELFREERGKTATYIILRAYSFTKNLNKIKERLISEIHYSTNEKRFKYCHYCSLLLKDQAMASFYYQFIEDAIDKNVDYTEFYESLRPSLHSLDDGNNKI